MIDQIRILDEKISDHQKYIGEMKNQIENLKMKLAQSEQDLNNRNFDNANISEKYNKNFTLINQKDSEINALLSDLKEKNELLDTRKNTINEYTMTLSGIEESRKKEIEEFKYKLTQYEQLVDEKTTNNSR